MGSAISLWAASVYAETSFKILKYEIEKNTEVTDERKEIEEIEKIGWDIMNHDNPEFFNVSKEYKEYENLDLETIIQKFREHTNYVRVKGEENWNDKTWKSNIKLMKISVCIFRRLLCIVRGSENKAKVIGRLETMTS